jgi:hypothetical protein
MESIFPSKFNCVNQICKSIKIGAMVPQFLSLIEGYSINEVIETDEKVIDRKAVIESTDRRPGAPARLVSFPEKMDKEPGWEAEYSLEDNIFSAWKRHRGNVKEIQSLPLKECCQREAELPVFINQSLLKSNLLDQ